MVPYLNISSFLPFYNNQKSLRLVGLEMGQACNWVGQATAEQWSWACGSPRLRTGAAGAQLAENNGTQSMTHSCGEAGVEGSSSRIKPPSSLASPHALFLSCKYAKKSSGHGNRPGKLAKAVSQLSHTGKNTFWRSGGLALHARLPDR